MYQRRARHARPPRLHVGPLMALDGIRQVLAAKREAEAATAAQNGTQARTGRLRQQAGTLALQLAVSFLVGAIVARLGSVPL